MYFFYYVLIPLIRQCPIIPRGLLMRLNKTVYYI